MYVPDLAHDDPCHDTANAYIPENVTRRANLPTTNYNLIAIAPWIDVDCTKSFFEAIKSDPLRALVVYLPDTDSSSPPEASDSTWDLNDGDSWRTKNHFPVYAISGVAGDRLMQQLSLYSGDLSRAPFSRNITSTYHPDPADYVRVWSELVIKDDPEALAVWSFVLIIIGVLISVIGGTSLLMHYVQRRRRLALRRRVELGDVNLEALGIKRLQVPLEHIRKFPLCTYTYEAPVAPSLVSSPASAAHGTRSAETDSEKCELATDYQPDCQICLEEFQSKQTIIRELPCGHIFHPECIDVFLSETSSLCPVCKASMLPPGYCPKITNGMVRKELATRRLRAREEPPHSEPGPTRTRLHSWSGSVKKQLGFSASSKQVETVELPTMPSVPRPTTSATMTHPPGRNNTELVPVDEGNSDDGRPPCEYPSIYDKKPLPFALQ